MKFWQGIDMNGKVFRSGLAASSCSCFDIEKSARSLTKYKVPIPILLKIVEFEDEEFEDEP